MPRNLRMDTGHSWDLEKKASDINDMKQATVSYMKFRKELTKYNVNVATRTLRLDFKYVHAEDS